MNTQAIRDFCDAWDAGKEIEVHSGLARFKVSKSESPDHRFDFLHNTYTVVEPPKLTVEVGRWYEDDLTDERFLVLVIRAGWVHFLTMSEPDERYQLGCVHEHRLTREVPCPEWAKAWYRKPGKVETESVWLDIFKRNWQSADAAKIATTRYIKATPEVLAALGETAKETP